LVRLWAHEGLRLFYDRLVKDEEKDWCNKMVDEMATKHFPSMELNALERPILFSNYLTKNYVSCDRD
jgi:dynein heavy chain 1